jgi:hypothetical protein
MFNLSDLHKITSILSPSGLLEHFKKLLGAYEEKVEENGELKKEVSELKDRLRKLIGEQEVPKFKPKKDLHHPRHEAIKSLIMTNNPIYILNDVAFEWIQDRRILNKTQLKNLKKKKYQMINEAPLKLKTLYRVLISLIRKNRIPLRRVRFCHRSKLFIKTLCLKF